MMATMVNVKSDTERFSLVSKYALAGAFLGYLWGPSARYRRGKIVVGADSRGKVN